MLPDGTLSVPERLEAPDGTVGVAFVEVPKHDPRYQRWLPFVQAAAPETNGQQRLSQKWNGKKQSETDGGIWS
jgi:hypothetical protein